MPRSPCTSTTASDPPTWAVERPSAWEYRGRGSNVGTGAPSMPPRLRRTDAAGSWDTTVLRACRARGAGAGRVVGRAAPNASTAGYRAGDVAGERDGLRLGGKETHAFDRACGSHPCRVRHGPRWRSSSGRWNRLTVPWRLSRSRTSKVRSTNSGGGAWRSRRPTPSHLAGRRHDQPDVAPREHQHGRLPVAPRAVQRGQLAVDHREELLVAAVDVVGDA